MAYTAVQTRLLNQRQSFATLSRISRSSRRVIPLSNYNNRIAQDAVKSVDETMSRNYQDGLVSPEDYENHLRDMLRRTDISQTDRAKITDKIRDVRRDVQIQSLESAYKQAPTGTQEQINAAQSLAGYYEEYAGSLVPGTPAHSNAQAQAAQWSQQTIAIQDKIEKAGRTTFRLKQLAEVAALPSTDPETAVEKAKVYAELRNMALEDGAVDEANRYESQFQGEIQRAEVLEQRQIETQKSEFKSEIVSYMNQNLDLYQDGKIGPQDALQALREAERAADEIGDFTLAVRVNSLRDRIEKDIERRSKEGVTSFRKQVINEIDAIELDISRLENAFKFGTQFEPESEFFGEESGPVDLNDFVNLRAMGMAAIGDIVDQAKTNGVSLPESRVARLEESLEEAMNNRNSFAGGRLVAMVDPGTQELILEDLDSPEEAQEFFEHDGISHRLSRREPENFGELQRLINLGLASPRRFATTGELTQAPEGQQSPFVVEKQNKFAGIDFLAPDTALGGDVPLFKTEDDSILAIRESDLDPNGDPGRFIKVESQAGDGQTVLKVIPGEEVRPLFDIDPVINVPSAQGGIESIFVKRDPETGEQIFFSEAQGRNIPQDQLSAILRGQTPTPLATDISGIVKTTQEGKPIEPEVVAPKQPFIGPPAPSPEPTPTPDLSPRPEISSSTQLKTPELKLPTIYPQNFIGPIPSGSRRSQPKQNIPLFPDLTPQQILKPQTTGEKVLSGALKAGATVQKGLKKIPFIGKFF